MNVDIHAITVCVNYSHLLKHCISNKRFFKRWVIVTVEDDIDTINLCEENGLEYMFSKTLYTRTFAKGCAINEAFHHLGYDKEWYLHIDADVLLPNNFPDIVQINPILQRPEIVGLKKYKWMEVDQYEKKGPYTVKKSLIDTHNQPFCLYSMGRVNVDEDEDMDNFNPQKYWLQPNKIQDENKGWGYFQLFHLPTFLRIHPDLYQIYPTLSNTAGVDDAVFSKIFHQIITLDMFCIHLSPEKINWKGIK